MVLLEELEEGELLRGEGKEVWFVLEEDLRFGIGRGVFQRGRGVGWGKKWWTRWMCGVFQDMRRGGGRRDRRMGRRR